MIGGFLGAGKTTVINRFAQLLAARDLKVGLITNDQGGGLVDSALGRSHSLPLEEIAGGCFCCRFNSLVDAARKLTASSRPDVFLAEPVGSCTDLVATVGLPLQNIYSEAYRVSPLSVVVDPVRALRILGLEEGKRFSENVRYIYRKQLEEAEVIAINKTDLVDAGRLKKLGDALASNFPEAKVISVSAREGAGLEAWLDHIIEAEIDMSRFLDIDYERYGEGETLLGWLNTSIEIGSKNDNEFDGDTVLEQLATSIQKKLLDGHVEIAHLKMTLTPLGDPYEIGAINLVRNESAPEPSHRLSEPLEDGEILLNIRAEANPDTLDSAVTDALGEILSTGHQLDFRITHCEHFRPSKPQPTHRLTA